ncbi:tRNA pseudouridine(55) synthase TruB [Sutterella sp.]|uniref:tRNA pseudouridine(55) synthase TruB n=1 Tax=Sutterella sp. TaxID=1981025 RepID=UPI0026E0DE9E|nr:tRNA pseudouridine(55) synthase TruB [Sutterella sp.]MDO5531082.1 tRNA pseudouridine(55) synthase TruB [Sutterella sp.]
MASKKGDSIHGVLLLDKPQGLSSNTAVQIARRIVNARKAGHTGTLDPMATGLLPVCFGDATKFSADLLNADKGYEARVRLGIETDTGDAEGEVIATHPVEGITMEKIEAAARGFLGTITQVPPMHSALKRDGVALYKLARRGETVERTPREVRILELEVSDFDGDSFTMKCLVSKGTYIRVLAEDIGRALGVGAHLTALRRTRVGHLTLDGALTLENLRETGTAEAARVKLTPADTLITTLPRTDLSEADEKRFLLGQRLALGLKLRGRVRVYGPVTGLLGTAVVNDRGVLGPERLIEH